MPSRQREVLQSLLACRTPALGGALHHCPQCDHRHFSYHSCNDRHCPQCGGQNTQQWLVDNAALLLPVHHFLVTFTVPDGLRRWIRSHPTLGYDLLLAASSQALQDLAHNPKRLGATLGLLGVLHTWTRTLEYHPHVHYLVPGGGLSLDQRQWISSRPKFLLPVKALSDRCRTLFREALQKRMPGALADHHSATLKLTFSFTLFVLLEGKPPPMRSACLWKFFRSQSQRVVRPGPSRPVIPDRTEAHLLLGSQNPLRCTAGDGERKTFRILREQRANEPWAAASFNPGM
jgi:hypothetical protein